MATVTLSRPSLIALLLVALLAPAAARAQQTTFTPNCSGTNDTAAFSNLIAAIGSNQGTIQLPYKATASRCAVNNLTIPANVTLDNAQGSGIKVNTGQTLTIVGPLSSPPGKQLFFNALSGQGTVSFAGNFRLAELRPEWWGAAGDDATDSAGAIQAALDAAAALSGRAKVVQAAGNFKTSFPLTLVSSNVTWEGAGPGATSIKPTFRGPSMVAYPGAVYPTAASVTGPALATGTGGSFVYGNTHWYNLRDAVTMNLDGLAAFTAEMYVKSSGPFPVDGSFLASSGKRYPGDAQAQAFTLALSGGNLRATLNVGGVTKTLTGSPLSADTVHHLALTYDGTTVRLFVDGTLVASTAATGTVTQAVHEDVTLGPSIQYWPDSGVLSNPPAGWADSVRVSRVARYASAFTMPTAKFGSDSNTLALLNFATQDKIFTSANTKDGVVQMWLRRPGLVGLGSITHLNIRDIQFNNGTTAFGPVFHTTLVSRLSNVKVTAGGPYGLLLWDNCYENLIDRLHVVGSQTARFAFANVVQGGVLEMISPILIGSSYPAVVYSGSVTMTNAYIQTESNTVVGLVAGAANESGLTLVNPIFSGESSTVSLETGVLLWNVGQVTVVGGTIDPYARPAVKIYGGIGHHFSGTRFGVTALAPSVFAIASAPQRPVTLVGVSQANGVNVPWSDSLKDVFLLSGSVVSGARSPVVSKTAAYTLTAHDETVLADATAGAFSLTLPTAVGVAGKTYTLKKTDASGNAVTVATTSAQTIDGAASYSLGSQSKYVTVRSDGANWAVVANN